PRARPRVRDRPALRVLAGGPDQSIRLHAAALDDGGAGGAPVAAEAGSTDGDVAARRGAQRPPSLDPGARPGAGYPRLPLRPADLRVLRGALRRAADR